MAQIVKNLPAMQETQVRSLGLLYLKRAGVRGLSQLSTESELFSFFSTHFLHIRLILEFHVAERCCMRSPNLFFSKSCTIVKDLSESYSEHHWL